MVIEVYDEGEYSAYKRYVITTDMEYLKLDKDEFLDLYRQMTRLLVDKVVEEYDPDKPRKGFGHSEPHKKAS